MLAGGKTLLYSMFAKLPPSNKGMKEIHYAGGKIVLSKLLDRYFKDLFFFICTGYFPAILVAIFALVASKFWPDYFFSSVIAFIVFIFFIISKVVKKKQGKHDH